MSSALIEVRVPPASNCDYFSKIFQATQVSKLPLTVTVQLVDRTTQDNLLWNALSTSSVAFSEQRVIYPRRHDHVGNGHNRDLL